MALGETLAVLRKKAGLSQEQLAETLGVTRQTISKWELNQSAPDIDYLVRLSDTYGVSTDFLLKGEAAAPVPSDPATDTVAYEPLDPHENRNAPVAYRWCFYLGLVCMGVSLLGITAFMICSALHPWTAMANNRVYEGILGFLVATKTLWFFNLLVAVCIAGCGTAVFGIVKARFSNK